MTDREYLAMEISTTVRSLKEPPWLPLVRVGHRVFSALVPEAAAARAERLFLTPPRPRGARRGRSISWRAPRHGRCAWARGGSRPGRGARDRACCSCTAGAGAARSSARFVAPLVARGFSVVTFDAPGHGASDDGVVTIPEMTAAIHAVAASRGPLAGLVAHSAGALTATAALSEGLDVDAAVFVGPPAELVGAAARFTETLGFSRPVRERMRERIATRVGRPWSAFDVIAQAATLTAPLLVVHDHGDARGAMAAGDGDHARVARGGDADDRRPRPSADPARPRRGGDRGGLRGRAHGRARGGRARWRAPRSRRRRWRRCWLARRWVRYASRRTGLRRVPTRSSVISTTSPSTSACSSGTRIPVPVDSTVPAGQVLLRRSQSTSSSGGRFISRGVDAALVEGLAAAHDRAREVQRRRGRDLAGGDQHRAQREAAVEHLGLGQEQRVLALDVPGREVVAHRVADDGAVGADDHGQLGLHRRQHRVAAHADRHVGADRA